jgi:hypothetical protein
MLLATTMAAVAALLLSLRAPSYVHAITVQNPSEYRVHVQVRGSGDDAWSELTTLDRGASRVVREVFDVGRDWTFRFQAQGIDAGEVRLARADLEAGGWSVAVPDAVVQQLHDRSAPPSPCPASGSSAGTAGCP